ncbi:MAG: hypothetical protein A2V66_13090 [Ignavibacteria bacterium RBG_13_36_8]|nr:MAG: hypothetical protein A2V66_13090 [Ignavibacteria bacterium RBG_13_36_8]
MRYLVIIVSLSYLIFTFGGNDFEWKSYDPAIIDIVKLGPPNYQLYDYMKEYSQIYGIPFDYALRCASEETGYHGKLDFKYRPFEDKLRRSYAEAYGPLQVQIPTANDMWNDRVITADDLGYDIKINVITSFRYKRYLYNKFKDWLKVYSIYNMGWKGESKINQYAVDIVSGDQTTG